jgi:prepilin-type N-terminal cleavage/methylation domain-containing protein
VTRLRDSSGFSLIEVMIAALIVVIGAGAAFSLIDNANRAVSFNSARIGSTNLSRELAEYARGTDYDRLQPDQVVAALRAHGTIAGTLSGGAWKVERRGVTYTIATSVCTFDDPKDGLSATPPPNPCPAAAAVAGAPQEVNPDDFRKVTFTMSWTARGRAGQTTQSALIVNPNGGLGPRITKFDPPPNQITADSIPWGPAPQQLISDPAAAVHWTTDDLNNGDAAGGPTGWGFTWELGPRFSTTTPWVHDGTYTVEAQAFDARGVPGEAKIVTVHINRGAPGEVSGLRVGYNATRNVVDMRWNRYDERDLQGYVVEREMDGTVTQVCPSVGDLQQGLSCTDPGPISATGAIYRVYAADCENLKTSLNCKRRGLPPATPPLVKPPANADEGTAPQAPTGLSATVVDGKPTLAWTAPDAGPNGPILFYRIYRDTGTGIADRYDETVTDAPSYTDPNPGSTTAHLYWVTAVDQRFNESAPSLPVLSPPVL